MYKPHKQYLTFMIPVIFVLGAFGIWLFTLQTELSFIWVLTGVVLVVGFFGLGYLKYVEKYGTRAFMHWCYRNGFSALDTGPEARQQLIEHSRQDPQKDWLRIFKEFKEQQQGPYAEGEYQGRKVWIYMLNAFQETLVEHQRYDAFLCVEISCAVLPEHVTVSRKGMQMRDTHDVESRHVEKMFNITARTGYNVLQLLDPRMLELLATYRVDAAEFGGKSVALFYKRFPITHFVLDQCLTESIAVVEQAERNYPTAKHA